MYSTTDFRKGLKIEIDGTPFEIIEFQHFKPGKGGAMVRTKLRNILNGRVLDNTFRSGEKVERPNLESRQLPQGRPGMPRAALQRKAAGHRNPGVPRP